MHIKDGEIAAVESYERLSAALPQVQVVGDGTGIVLPGLVNTHTHLSEAFLAGLGSDLPLFTWGQEIITPAGRHLTREMAREGSVLKVAELIRSGVTCINDMFVHGNPDSYASLGVAEGLALTGMRGVVSFGAEDAVGGLCDTEGLGVSRILDEQEALFEIASSNALVGFRYGIGTLLGQSDELLAAGAALCHDRDWGIHTHLAEVNEELLEARERWGHRTIDHAESLGILSSRLLAAHVIWVTESDIELLAERSVSVAHNPVANMILGSGVCPVTQLQAAGLAVGIGTDGAASNDSQNMLEAVKATSLLQKVHHTNPAILPAQKTLEMATIDGARALGLEHEIGSLELGKRADVVLAGGTAELATIHDPYQQIVYCTSPRSISDVWIDGHQVLRACELVAIDEDKQIDRCRPLAESLTRDAGLQQRGWSWLSTT
ncbi:MAG: amidohydrolase [Acidimicrobiales bacterium]|nr:amidohydrolase [Acidimicrobiales bacterium]